MRFTHIFVLLTVCTLLSTITLMNSNNGDTEMQFATLNSELEATPGQPSNPTPLSAEASPAKFAIEIHQPDGPPMIELKVPDSDTAEAKIACSTCHSLREPDFSNKSDVALDQFHQGLKVSHGQLACYACHNPQDMGALRAQMGPESSFEM